MKAPYPRKEAVIDMENIKPKKIKENNTINKTAITEQERWDRVIGEVPPIIEKAFPQFRTNVGTLRTLFKRLCIASLAYEKALADFTNHYRLWISVMHKLVDLNNVKISSDTPDGILQQGPLTSRLYNILNNLGIGQCRIFEYYKDFKAIKHR